MHAKLLKPFAWLLTLLVACGAIAQPDDDAFTAEFQKSELQEQELQEQELQESELDPYEAKVAVESQTELLRQRAMSQGLRDVIVRLLGSDTALSEPEIVRALRAPQQYVAQFSYVRDYPAAVEDADSDAEDEDSYAGANDSYNNDAGDVDVETQPQLETFLSMHFLPGRVDGLLQAANQLEVGQLQNVAIAVQGVIDFADFATALTALQGLAMVREVSPVLVLNETVDFSVHFEGDVELLTIALEEETRLQSLDEYFDPVFDDQLNYELGPEIINFDD